MSCSVGMLFFTLFIMKSYYAIFISSLLNLQIGGVKTVTLGDQEARITSSKKIILEREASPAFPFLIEVREKNYWVIHRVSRSLFW